MPFPMRPDDGPDDPPRPTDYGTARLRVEPSAIPTAKQVFQEAADKVEELLRDAFRKLRLTPWWPDPVTDEWVRRYADVAVGGPTSMLAHLQAYYDELLRVVDALRRVEDLYRTTEGDNAALMDAHG